MDSVLPLHDYYKILDVKASATADEIKKSYYRLARTHHPDKNGGTKAATAKFQLINSAWEILRDGTQRKEYDKIHAIVFKTASSTKSAKPTSPGKTRPEAATEGATSKAEREKRGKEDGKRKRQEWLNWEKAQDEKIRTARKKITTLETELAALHARNREDEDRISAANRPWWSAIGASRGATMSETERTAITREMLQREAAMKSKLSALERNRTIWSNLQLEKHRREAIESERMWRELAQKDMREMLARQMLEAERWRQQAEKMARERDIQEARLRAEREQAAKEETARKKQAAKERKAREEADRKIQEEWLSKMFKETTREQEEARPTQRPATTGSFCRHQEYWIKINGRQHCSQCNQTQNRFAFQCPGCNVVACASCRTTLRKMRNSSVNPDSHETQERRSHRRTKSAPQYDKTFVPSDVYENEFDEGYAETYETQFDGEWVESHEVRYENVFQQEPCDNQFEHNIPEHSYAPHFDEEYDGEEEDYDEEERFEDNYEEDCYANPYDYGVWG